MTGHGTANGFLNQTQWTKVVPLSRKLQRLDQREDAMSKRTNAGQEQQDGEDDDPIVSVPYEEAAIYLKNTGNEHKHNLENQVSRKGAELHLPPEYLQAM